VDVSEYVIEFMIQFHVLDLDREVYAVRFCNAEFGGNEFFSSKWGTKFFLAVNNCSQYPD